MDAGRRAACAVPLRGSPVTVSPGKPTGQGGQKFICGFDRRHRPRRSRRPARFAPPRPWRARLPARRRGPVLPHRRTRTPRRPLRRASPLIWGRTRRRCRGGCASRPVRWICGTTLADRGDRNVEAMPALAPEGEKICRSRHADDGRPELGRARVAAGIAVLIAASGLATSGPVNPRPRGLAGRGRAPRRCRVVTRPVERRIAYGEAPSVRPRFSFRRDGIGGASRPGTAAGRRVSVRRAAPTEAGRSTLPSASTHEGPVRPSSTCQFGDHVPRSSQMEPEPVAPLHRSARTGKAFDDVEAG